jgi:serine/threonine protein kinase
VATDGRVKVLDFGLARVGGPLPAHQAIEATRPVLTSEGMIVGTMPYMSPEQVEGRPLDPRSDLFSLGVILYEMATGRLPFAGATPSDTVTNVLDREPEPLTTLAPDRPIALEHVVMRLLAKRAADRYQSAEHLAEALGRIEAPPTTLATRLLRRLRPAR